ncbi:MAG: hypothetical protein N3A66_04405 [Planctomycetota bacterium]|nr:hypothetical protein [Planctomycetota bacterium]
MVIYTLVYRTPTRSRVNMPGVKEDAMRTPDVNPLGTRVAKWEGGRWVSINPDEWILVQTPDIHPVDFSFAVEVPLPWGKDIVAAEDIDADLVRG